MTTKPNKASTKRKAPVNEEAEILSMMDKEDTGESHRDFSEIEINLDNPEDSSILLDGDMSDEEFEQKFIQKDKEVIIADGDDEVEVIADEEEPAPVKKPEEPQDKAADKDSEEEEIHKSRARERVREAVAQKNEAERKAKEAEQRELALRLGYAKQMSARYAGDIQASEKRLKEAMQENDPDAFIAAQRELNEAQTSKAQLDKFLEDAPKQTDKQATKDARITDKDVQDTAGLPEVARSWLELKSDYLDPDKYKTLPLNIRKKVLPIRRDTYTMSNELRDEGYSPEDSAFYEELDMRLTLKYPIYEDLALLGISVLDSDTEDTKKSSSSAETLKPTEKAKKKTTLPVSASVGSSSAPPSSKKVSLRVSVTAEQEQFYNDYLKNRMTFKDYVKQIALDKQQYPDD